jgi:hypothetical protein
VGESGDIDFENTSIWLLRHRRVERGVLRKRRDGRRRTRLRPSPEAGLCGPEAGRSVPRRDFRDGPGWRGGGGGGRVGVGDAAGDRDEAVQHRFDLLQERKS